MYSATPTFSVPKSDRTLDGKPKWLTASKKSAVTVSDLLFAEHLRKTMQQLKPSIPP